MIYLDYAASAPPFPQVADRVHQVMTDCFGNPGAIHSAATDGRGILQESRRTLAKLLKVREQEIFFTSGGTEANNWAVKLGCRNGERKHILVSATEHKSVIESASAMTRLGYQVSLLTPDRDGVITPDALESALRPDTALVCIQAVNNETGVMQDVAALASIAKKNGTRFLCDGVQAFGHTQQMLHKADFISLSAHKLGGPRGVGCLVIRYPNFLPPFIDGGGQEQSLRSGTENTPGIAGFALAAQLSAEIQEAETARLAALSAAFAQKLTAISPEIQINAQDAARYPGILNCRFPGLASEEMVMWLDLKGICASPGAACAARDKHPSHVLLAMGLSDTEAKESVRFSFGRLTTEEELTTAAECIEDIWNKRRKP